MFGRSSATNKTLHPTASLITPTTGSIAFRLSECGHDTGYQVGSFSQEWVTELETWHPPRLERGFSSSISATSFCVCTSVQSCTHTHCTPVGSWSLWYDLERLRALAVKAGSPSVSSRGYGCAARLCLWGQDRAAAHQLWRRGLVRFRNTTSQSQHFTGEASHSHTAGGVGVARQKVLRQTATMCCDELSSRDDLVCQGV